MLNANATAGCSHRSTPSWRFHSSGFGTGINAEMAVVGRPASTAPASTTATTHNVTSPFDYEVAGAGTGTGTVTGPAGGGGMNKRPLPTCREELERGWQRNMYRCVSNDASSSSSSSSSSYYWGKEESFLNNDDDDGFDCVDDDMLGSGGGGGRDDSGNVNNKRRRISAPHEIGGEEDEIMNTVDNDDGPSPPPLPVVRRVRIARCDPGRDVKPGWYEGPVDVYGNRHGYGITKHDDGTEYEGQYVNDVMSGCHGRYSLAPYHRLVMDPNDGIANDRMDARTGNNNIMRRIEVKYVGSFRNDVPHGVGTTITRTVDYRANNDLTPCDIREGGWQQQQPHPPEIRSVEVTYDIGVHDTSRNAAVGEGVRVVYRSRATIDRLIDGGRTINTTAATWEKSCYRLMNGRDANLSVADEYAAWIVQCMGAAFPGPPHGQAGWGGIG